MIELLLMVGFCVVCLFAFVDFLKFLVRETEKK
jgi:hypothetical protein